MEMKSWKTIEHYSAIILGVPPPCLVYLLLSPGGTWKTVYSHLKVPRNSFMVTWQKLRSLLNGAFKRGHLLPLFGSFAQDPFQGLFS